MKIVVLAGLKSNCWQCLYIGADAQIGTDRFKKIRDAGGDGFEQLILIVRPPFARMARFNVTAPAVAPAVETPFATPARKPKGGRRGGEALVTHADSIGTAG